jgi:flagellar M-ring protein FliF
MARLAPAQRWVTSLSRPARVLLASTLIVLALLGAWLTWRSSVANWGVLYTQLDRDDAAALVNKLKELKVPYRLQGEGSTIEVPEEKVHELRLELASAGLPRGGGVGFEAFDRMRLGATEFEQRVMFRRALEGELGRTISSLGAVQSARVHLVMTERSVFVSRNDPASASVVVRLRPGRHLGPAEVSGIVHMVASSVPSLDASRVALVTTEGEMLHRPRAPGDEESAEDERSSGGRTLESSIEERTRALLARLVGEGHVDVRASVDMDHARVERTEDHYDRAHTALRSEEQTQEFVTAAGNITVAGVPGAESNIGTPSEPVDPAQPDGGVLREQHTRNFEVDHVSERRLTTRGVVKRITVAVVVDGVTRTEGGQTRVVPRDAAELAHLSALVRGAIGANTERGDVVTVESIPFQETLDAPVTTAARRVAARPSRTSRAYVIGGVVAVAAVLLGVALLALRRRSRPENTTGIQIPGLPPQEPVPQLDPEVVRESLRAQVHARVLADPATAALVLRFWLGTDAPDRNNAKN